MILVTGVYLVIEFGIFLICKDPLHKMILLFNVYVSPVLAIRIEIWFILSISEWLAYYEGIIGFEIDMSFMCNSPLLVLDLPGFQ